jgi:hypothetical protein
VAVSFVEIGPENELAYILHRMCDSLPCPVRWIVKLYSIPPILNVILCLLRRLGILCACVQVKELGSVPEVAQYATSSSGKIKGGNGDGCRSSC